MGEIPQRLGVISFHFTSQRRAVIYKKRLFIYLLKKPNNPNELPSYITTWRAGEQNHAAV